MTTILSFDLPDKLDCEIKYINFQFESGLITIRIDGNYICKVSYADISNMADIIKKAEEVNPTT